ncbi:HDR008Cp [Eremothecium sinecaudum]|uniref:Translation machinery-associated protein 20 n=1 Tax=Eremothecium sinecaudum TaxID=45286 RepID=A0A0X8HSQ3_9SACH|nr:HDR008Cp [Eremothecium sinecaudum]AMD20751.1 HDR008Cp [Eremothecium sinecaudum]
MFKKFSKEDIHTRTKVKSSVQRSLKTKLVEQFPKLEPVIDELIPKKAELQVIKCSGKIQLYTVGDEVYFFQNFDELIPTLKFVHKFPEAFPTVQVDRGAIKFVLSGANIMCPGLTSAGAKLPEDPGYEKDALVIVNAENKENALAVGRLLMSTNEIKSINKGHGVEMIHHLGDCLWNFNLD